MFNQWPVKFGGVVCAIVWIINSWPAAAADQKVGAATKPRETVAAAEKSRDFLFTYSATVTDVKPETKVRIWLPVPPTNEDQQVRFEKMDLSGRVQFGKETKYSNEILYIEATAGAEGVVPLSVTYRIHRSEVKADAKSSKVAAEDAALFLKADAKVPVGGKPLMLIEGKKLPGDQFQLARALYNVVNDHMTYSKQGTGWGRGDSVWACDSKYGNCSDFHSLFISLARAKQMPAKFEMGFPLPDARGAGEIPGYHCWAKFKPEGRGWIPVDISEANKVKDKNPGMVEYYFGNLTENRVAFSVGRDITLVPKQAGPPLNFFVYPYVEVANEPYPADKVQRKFTFQDLP